MICRPPSPCGVLHDTPAGNMLFGCTRSLTIVELVSHAMMLAFPLKLTPEKSALEFTRANTPGPEFPDTCPPRKNTSELPSIRIPALRESPREPLPSTIFAPAKYD